MSPKPLQPSEVEGTWSDHQPAGPVHANCRITNFPPKSTEAQAGGAWFALAYLLGNPEWRNALDQQRN